MRAVHTKPSLFWRIDSFPKILKMCLLYLLKWKKEKAFGKQDDKKDGCNEIQTKMEIS